MDLPGSRCPSGRTTHPVASAGRVFSALAVAATLAGCSEGTDSHLSPVADLQSAINAVLTTSNYTVTITMTPAPPGLLPADTVVIQNSNRVAINDNRIAIASTGYRKSPGGQLPPAGPRNFVNTSLVYIHLLHRATAVQRYGNTCVVRPAEAASLVLSSGQSATGVSLSAKVASGMLKSLRLTTTTPPSKISNVVSKVILHQQ